MEKVEYDIVYTIDDIMRMLPHRYPFLLIDKVNVRKGELSGMGVKNVTINEPYFAGHFPNEPIVPGVLIIESIAQTIAIVYGSEKKLEGFDEDVSAHVGYLVSANIKFLNKVTVGDTMSIYVKCETHFNKFSSYRSTVYVDNKLIAKGNLLVSER